MKDYKRWSAVFCLILSFFLSGCHSGSQEIQWDVQEETICETEFCESTSEEQTETEVVKQSIFVDICGAVKKPGVYELEEGARIYQVIELAGGLLPEADDTAINRAEVLTDGSKIRVLTVEETAGLSERSNQGMDRSESQEVLLESSGEKKVNINTADATQLTTLPGIGQTRAQDIIAYRNEHGGFSSIEEIMNVGGIKDATYNKIKDKITTE